MTLRCNHANNKKFVSRLAEANPKDLKSISGFMYSSFDDQNGKMPFTNNKEYGCSHKTEKKHRRVSAKYGSNTLRKNLSVALSSIPVETKPKVCKRKPKVKAVISTSLYFNQNPPKKFKKELISKPFEHKPEDYRNSLNRFINLQSKPKPKAVIDLETTKLIARESSTTKISKIEYQIKKHCLNKKGVMKHPGKTLGKCNSTNPYHDTSNNAYLTTFKSEESDRSGKEEGDTRNTSKQTSANRSTPHHARDREVDGSFMYADIDLGDKKEAHGHEKRLSEKMTTSIYKSFSNNFKKLFKSKSYGCDCGRAKDESLDCCVNAEEWLKYAFQGSHKKFGKKDKKVFKELIEMDCKKESKSFSDSDDRIPLTVCIENDLKRTFPNEKFFQSERVKKTLFNVLKAYTLYDNTCGYVQGMNFIAGALVYHASPDIAFWLFVSLIFDYQLRDNYRAGFPGVKELNEQIKCLMKIKLPKLSKLFEETETDFEMFTLEIIMSLFGIAIPLKCTKAFYDNFFQSSWEFFVKLIIAFLEEIQGTLEKLEDPWEMIRTIKAHTNPHLPKASNLIDSSIKIKGIDWERLIEKASKM